MTSVDDKGVKAIIYLQALVGIEEPVEEATRGWNSLADWEKEQTLQAYRLCKDMRNDG